MSDDPMVPREDNDLYQDLTLSAALEVKGERDFENMATESAARLSSSSPRDACRPNRARVQHLSADEKIRNFPGASLSDESGCIAEVSNRERFVTLSLEYDVILLEVKRRRGPYKVFLSHGARPGSGPSPVHCCFCITGLILAFPLDLTSLKKICYPQESYDFVAHSVGNLESHSTSHPSRESAILKEVMISWRTQLVISKPSDVGT